MNAARWQGLLVVLTSAALVGWLMARRRKTIAAHACRQAVPALDSYGRQTQEGGVAGVHVYSGLVAKYLTAFFEAYERSLRPGSFTSVDLQSMLACSSKVEKYMHELEFRRCNDLSATTLHARRTRDMLRALEAYISDAAQRNRLHYIARVL
jgi:hypothetical protein